MDDNVVVFLGPTLEKEKAAGILAATYLPPADQGSVFYATEYLGAQTIVLIDGVFGRVPAVRHKEILWALSRNVRVYGASSMGALRAAELARFGMLGYGLVFRWYRATPLADDDEVAVAMGPIELGAPALGEALINIRVTLRRAQAAGLLTPPMRHWLVRLARSIHFRERSYEALFSAARAHCQSSDNSLILCLEKWVSANAVDQKKADAVELLQRLADQSNFARLSAQLVMPPPLTQTWITDLREGGFDCAQIFGPYCS
jgi:hypothetical protein